VTDNENNKSKARDRSGPTIADLQVLSEAYQSGRLDEAKRLAGMVAQEFPRHSFAWKVLGAILQQSGQVSESLPILRKCIQLAPDDEEAHNNLGAALQSLGRMEEAASAYQCAVSLRPDFAEAYGNLATVFQRLGRLQDAEISYRQAAALHPDNSEAYKNFARFLFGQNRFGEAEINFRRAVSCNPNCAESYSDLGNLLIQQNNYAEAEIACSRALEINPEFPEAHNNLANSLRGLGRLEEAVASYRLSIELGLGLPETYCNLGTALQELARHQEAKYVFRQAIEIRPDFAEAHSRLGVALKAIGDSDGAVAHCKHALSLKPSSAEVHDNLGFVLQELGMLVEAEAAFQRATLLLPDSADAMYNLSTAQSYMNDLDAERTSLQKALPLAARDQRFKAHVNLAICDFLQDDADSSRDHLSMASSINIDVSSSLKNEQVYWGYLQGLLGWHEKCSNFELSREPATPMYVVGESHSLASHGLIVPGATGFRKCQAILIKGCKQWHLGNKHRNKYKYQFEAIFRSLPRSSEVVLTIGEIDCRPDGGVIDHKRKFPEKRMEEIIASTVHNFVAYVERINSTVKHTVAIQGVPCPNVDRELFSEEELTQLIWVIGAFNGALKLAVKSSGFQFLDVHELTDRGDGFSNGRWHLDPVHLSPSGFLEAWRRVRAI